MKRYGFTLIELLIVVAIIAVLAAIAVPNFMEAQTRAKVARTQSDIRTQAMALESYFVDNGAYTRDSDSSLDTQGQVSGHQYTEMANGVVQLTTPIAYMTTVLDDPFAKGTQVMAVGGGAAAIGYRIASGSWSYGSSGFNDDQGSYQVFKEQGPRQCYAIIGIGPDKARARMGYKCFPFEPANNPAEGPVGTELNTAKGNQPNCWTEYDPTNGTISVGDVYRFGGAYTSGRFMLNGKIVGQETPVGGAAF